MVVGERNNLSIGNMSETVEFKIQGVFQVVDLYILYLMRVVYVQ